MTHCRLTAIEHTPHELHISLAPIDSRPDCFVGRGHKHVVPCASEAAARAAARTSLLAPASQGLP